MSIGGMGIRHVNVGTIRLEQFHQGTGDQTWQGQGIGLSEKGARGIGLSRGVTVWAMLVKLGIGLSEFVRTN